LEVFLKLEAHCFYILLSSRLQLCDHVIISDLSLKIDTSIMHYEWKLDKIAFSEDEEACSAQSLTILGD
jgi:hypothetical protein